MVKVTNAFSIQMLNASADVSFRQVTEQEARELLGTQQYESCIGHPDTAAVLTDVLGVEVPYRRGFVTLDKSDTLLVCQLSGGRLPEGTTTLPDGFRFTYWVVTML
jgi:hypothetical protein